jgi:NADH-quinone oxidoreductase subunit G
MLSYREAVDDRMLSAVVGGEDATVEDALVAARDALEGHADDPVRIAIVLSARHSNEDNFALATLAKTFLGAGDFYVTGRPLGRSDDILISADKNPNTRGAVQVASTTPPRPFAELIDGINAGKYAYAICLGSEMEVEPAAAGAALAKLKGVVTICAHDGPLARASQIALPACAWAEADGTYVNKQGLAQRSEKALRARGDARPGWELVSRLAKSLGYALEYKKLSDVHRAMAPEAYAAFSSEPKGPGSGEISPTAGGGGLPMEGVPVGDARQPKKPEASA